MQEKVNFKIGNKIIGSGNPVFVVAEISANHRQSFATAKKLVETACDMGADAVKLQTYTPDTLTINCSKKWFQIKTNSAWRGKTLYHLYKEAYMPWAWQPKLKKIAEERGVILFSTPFDETAVDFLEKMGVPAYKVASFEIGDLELLKKIAQTRKPVIFSRGMASAKEIKTAILTLKRHGARNIAVLHCISSYPAKAEEMNLSMIADIKNRFKVMSGFSDHTLDPSVPIVAVASGAKIIEKHLTLKRKDGGPDSSFSLEPKEFKQMVENIRKVEAMTGKVEYGAGKRESENIVFRRSLFVIKDVKRGEKFTRENVKCIRPGYGLQPEYLKSVLGKKTKKDIESGTPLSRNLIQ